MTPYQSEILSNLSAARFDVEKACLAAGRQPSDVKILLATKTVAAENVRVVIEQGKALLVGENRIQELVQKSQALSDLQYERHFIGHLQTNKIKEAIKYASCIQSVDRIDLVEKLDQQLQKEGRQIDIFVQVNTSFEESKFGMEPDLAKDFVKKIGAYDTLRIRGFMTIGLFSDDEAAVRRSYVRLREIRDEIIGEGIVDTQANQLSMGMSGDFALAIAEGATMVRLGTTVFGKRVY